MAAKVCPTREVRCAVTTALVLAATCAVHIDRVVDVKDISARTSFSPDSNYSQPINILDNTTFVLYFSTHQHISYESDFIQEYLSRVDLQDEFDDHFCFTPPSVLNHVRTIL